MIKIKCSANVFHEIYNNGNIESEYIFVRIHNTKNEI